MTTYLTEIIPKIQKFSKRLDDLTKLTNQHWVYIDDLKDIKTVFLFGNKGDLDIYENGIEIDSGSWRLIENNSIQLKFKNRPGLLLKHGFFDGNIIALKIDSKDHYAFFVNENKYHSELNSITDILRFLENRYINNKENKSVGNSSQKPEIKPNVLVTYQTDKGSLSIEQPNEHTFPEPGNNTFINGRPAPNGKFKFGFMWFVHVKEGKVSNVTLF
jgi:hypothetical protein